MVAQRVDLRACAAIGQGCREAVESDGRGVAEIGPTRAAIVRLGEDAAARLAAIPDTPELEAGDRVFAAEYPLAAYRKPAAMVRLMCRLVERYRDECDIDTAIIKLTIAEAYVRCVARLPCPQGGDGT